MRRFSGLGFVLASMGISGCGVAPTSEEAATGAAMAEIGVTGAIPFDAVCTHIVATRLADFQVAELQGGLAGARFAVPTGEARVTATAYLPPCGTEPSQPPWVADAQLFTFVAGANTLRLHFHQNDSVTIDPVFDDTRPPVVTETAGRVRVSRNNEDAAGPGFTLDGWEVKRTALPPLAPSETVLFSMEGKGGLPYSPRGLAAMADGTFVVQVSETNAPLRQFDAAGNFLESWPVVYPDGTRRADLTDGIEAIDADHLVRTAFFNNGVDCDADGFCTNSMIETLERVTTLSGAHEVRVTAQIVLPVDFRTIYPLGVTPLPDGNFAVSLFLGGGTELIVIDRAGALRAGPLFVTGGIEGLFVANDGRLGGIDYHGALAMYDAPTLTPRAEAANYALGLSLASPNGLAWNPNTGTFLALSDTDRALVIAPPNFASSVNTGIDLRSFRLVSGLAYRADTNEVLLVDRVPPLDPATGLRTPAVDVYNLATAARTGRIVLRGLPSPLRTRQVAYVPARGQLVTSFQRPSSVPDPKLDAVVFTSGLDGTLLGQFDLAPLGVRRISTVAYLATTDELLLGVIDQFGVPRYLVTSPTGTPRRSYRVDALGGIGSIAEITSGADTGRLGFLTSQPSAYVRVALP